MKIEILVAGLKQYFARMGQRERCARWRASLSAGLRTALPPRTQVRCFYNPDAAEPNIVEAPDFSRGSGPSGP